MRLSEFDKVRKFVEKWASENGKVVAQISIDDEELTFYDETRGCATRIIGIYWINDEELELGGTDEIFSLWDM